MDNKINIIQDFSGKCFKLLQEGACSHLDYEIDGNTINLCRVFVPDSLRGKGIAAQLVCEALQYAKKHNLAVIPTCPYVRTYMQRKGLIGR